MKLKLRGNNLNDKAICNLAKALLQNGHMQVLDLSQNCFGVVGLSALTECIVGSPLLRKLNLNENGISAEGGEYVSNIITYCRGLRKVVVLSSWS